MAACQLAPLSSSLNSQRSASLLLDPIRSAGSPFPRLGQLGEGAVTFGAAVTKWDGSPGQPAQREGLPKQEPFLSAWEPGSSQMTPLPGPAENPMTLGFCGAPAISPDVSTVIFSSCPQARDDRQGTGNSSVAKDGTRP